MSCVTNIRGARTKNCLGVAWYLLRYHGPPQRCGLKARSKRYPKGPKGMSSDGEIADAYTPAHQYGPENKREARRANIFIPHSK